MGDHREDTDTLREGPEPDRQKRFSANAFLSKEEMEQVLTYLVNELWKQRGAIDVVRRGGPMDDLNINKDKDLSEGPASPEPEEPKFSTTLSKEELDQILGNLANELWKSDWN